MSALIDLYFAYKRFTERRAVDLLSQHVWHGAQVVDVGANRGFFTMAFEDMGADVVAIEPEPRNAEYLRRYTRARVHEYAALDRGGSAGLTVDRLHNGNHRVSADGVPIKCVTIDSMWLAPALIKIDVQGTELQVLRGAVETIRMHRPALFVEVHAPSLALYGTDEAELFRFFDAHGYKLVDSVYHFGYRDVLMVPHA